MKLPDEKRFDAALKICLAQGSIEERVRLKALQQVDALWAEVQGNSHLDQLLEEAAKDDSPKIRLSDPGAMDALRERLLSPDDDESVGLTD